MVMDVEGTDGRERGEDQASTTPHAVIYDNLMSNRLIAQQDFERKSALFSLASSEVLIVNMWEHQVGLYQGANMSLLKTVFEVNLGLFGKKQMDGYVDINIAQQFGIIISPQWTHAPPFRHSRPHRPNALGQPPSNSHCRSQQNMGHPQQAR